MIEKTDNYLWRKIFRIMKLGTLCMSFSLYLTIAANTYSQITLLTLDLPEVTVKEVLDKIEENSEYVFFYYDNILDVNRKVKINVRNQTIDKVLNQLFEGTENAYLIEDRQIYITRKERAFSGPSISGHQRKQVTGKVTDEFDDPLPGATIIVQGSTRGVTTDLDGSFEIEVESTDKLVISYLGMQEQVIQVGNQQIIVVRLLPKVDELQEITVVAYGRQKKESVIGAITTLEVDNIKMPGSKLSTSLAGQMAGIVAVQRSGEPGSGSDFWIRGINTFGANSTPLVLVDGMERDLDLVDPEDIESFAILKDATATAVYGVRGANGIILVTTKKGKEGKPVVNAKVETGFLSPVRIPKMASTEKWLKYYNDITSEATGTAAFSSEEVDKYLSGYDPDLYPNVDWMKEIYRNSTTNQRVSLNVSGGGTNVRYYVSGLYYTENGIFNVNVGDQYDPSVRYSKYSFRANLDIDITKSTTLSLNLANHYEIKNRLGTDMDTMYEIALYTTPIATPTIYSDGTLAMPTTGGGSNPYYYLNHTGFSQDYWNNAESLFSLTQDFSDFVTQGLKGNVKLAWDSYSRSIIDKRKAPNAYEATGRDEEGNLIFVQSREGTDYLSLNQSNKGTRTLNIETSLTYDNVFNSIHRIGGLFLFNMREHVNTQPQNNYIKSIPYRYIGFAGRATYAYKDTYFLEGNFGYNGSENFAPGNRFGFFPAVAIGYLISNENYFQNAFPFIDLLKIKASYGEIGNDKISDEDDENARRFAYNSEMTDGGSYVFGDRGQTTLYGIATGHPGNPNVSWETAKKANVGLELGLFNRFRFQADYFHEKREGIYIMQESVPSVVGNNVTQYVNLGRMKNQGMDMSLEYTQQFRDFFISGRANFTFARNKKLYDDKATPEWGYQELAGKRLNQQVGLIAVGLFESEEDIATSPTQNFGVVRVGDIKYRDINGDGVIDSYDEVPIGHTTVPEISYGFGVSMGYKGFDLSLFFQGVGNTTRLLNGTLVKGSSYNNLLQYGQIYADLADKRWTAENPNPNAEYPRMSLAISENNYQHSTFWQRNMSFIRLKNVEIGYSLPRNIIKRIGLSNLRFYVNSTNPLTFAKFKLWDPELDTANGQKYPQMKTVNLGLNVNF